MMAPGSAVSVVNQMMSHGETRVHETTLRKFALNPSDLAQAFSNAKAYGIEVIPAARGYDSPTAVAETSVTWIRSR